jgi:hypothetical protein
MRGSKIIRTGFAALLLGFSSLAHAQFFIGADATWLNSEIEWPDSQVYFDHEMTPARLRLGYQGDFFGLEAHIYSKNDDDAESNGFTTNLEFDTSYGLYLRMQEKWVYARLGVTWFDTYYSVYDPLNPGVVLVTDRDVIAMPTFTFGIEVPLGEHIGINLDYTYAEGTAVYPNITAQGPGLTNPNMVVTGPAVGVTFKF